MQDNVYKVSFDITYLYMGSDTSPDTYDSKQYTGNIYFS